MELKSHFAVEARPMRRTKLIVAICGIAIASVALSISVQDPPLVSILIFIPLLVWACAAALLPGYFVHAPLRTRLLIGAAGAIALSVMTTHWPVRLAFAASRSEFETLADQIDGGNIPQVPKRIGPFLVQEAGLNVRGRVFFWTSTEGAGSIGFVRCPDDLVRSQFNVWSTLKLGHGWHLVAED
jgi:hypothetical protein